MKENKLIHPLIKYTPIEKITLDTKYIRLINASDQDICNIGLALKDSNAQPEVYSSMLEMYFTMSAEEQLHEVCDTKVMTEDQINNFITTHTKDLTYRFLDGHVPLDDEDNEGRITHEYIIDNAKLIKNVDVVLKPMSEENKFKWEDD